MSDAANDGRGQDDAEEAVAVPRPADGPDADAEVGMAAPESGAD